MGRRPIRLLVGLGTEGLTHSHYYSYYELKNQTSLRKNIECPEQPTLERKEALLQGEREGILAALRKFTIVCFYQDDLFDFIVVDSIFIGEPTATMKD